MINDAALTLAYVVLPAGPVSNTQHTHLLLDVGAHTAFPGTVGTPPRPLRGELPRGAAGLGQLPARGLSALADCCSCFCVSAAP